jgi:pimeloyl-ACP methyl ester carboxylesterase
MNGLTHAFYRSLATNCTGAALVVALLLIGIACLRVFPVVAWCMITLAVLAGIGVAKFFLRDRQRETAPGRRVVVDGIAMHLLADGRAEGAHPIVWIGGGHGEGLVMVHLHRAAAIHTRSLLFDRAGAGWSDFGELPLTIVSEVERLKRLLDTAGERGPFVLAGHSFGGLFALNFAHRYPDMVVGVVGMDPTPPDNVTWAGQLSFGRLLRLAPWRALALQLGITRAGDPEIDDPTSAFGRCMGEWAPTINRNSLQPKSVIAEAAAFRGAMDHPFDMVNGTGALHELPLVLLLANPTPQDDDKMHAQVRSLLGLDPVQEANFWSAMDESMDQQRLLSSRARVVRAPVGATHMFPYEHPEFVLREVFEMAAVRVTSPADGAATGSPAR